MLETVFAKFITKYLNEYIETLNKSQMEMELWKGHAVFQNLVLLPTALTNHQIPFKIKKGTIGKVNLNLPWKKLNSEACIIEISDVYIILEIDTETFIKQDLQAQQTAIHTSEEVITKEDEKGTWQSIINTVIDNARVSIQNIHIRLEIQHATGPISVGAIIPSLTLNTCDSNKVPLMHIVQRSATELHKLLMLSDFAVYLDTMDVFVDLNSGVFEQQMFDQIQPNYKHQFVLHPFTLECLLKHTRGNSSNFKNILSASTLKLTIALDYMQCRTLIDINKRWAMFGKRRKYAACARPKNFNVVIEKEDSYPEIYDIWQYTHRCSVQKNRPNEFNPVIALKILKNRQKYLKLYRKKEKQKKVPHPIIKKQLKTLEAKVGSQAALFLKEYSSAVVLKETNIKNSGLTAFDMSELKGILQTGDRFFEMDSFSFNMNVPAFQIELLYSENNLLFSTMFVQLSMSIKSLKSHAEVLFGIMDLTAVSFIQGSLRTIIGVDFDSTNQYSSQDFLHVVSLIPRTTDPFSLSVSMQSVTTTFDSETIDRIMEFFIEDPNSNSQDIQSNEKKMLADPDQRNIKSDDLMNDNSNTKINLVDASEQLHRLLYFKNYKLNVTLKGLRYVYPFKHNDEKKEIQFSINDLSVIKTATGLITKELSEISMNFLIKFTIDDMMIADCCIFRKIYFDLPFSFIYYYGNDNVKVSCNFKMTKFDLNISNQAIKYIASALNHSKKIALKTYSSYNNKSSSEFNQASTKIQEKSVISYKKINARLNFMIEMIKINLDGNEIFVKNINSKFSIEKDIIDSVFQIEKTSFIIDGEEFINLPDNAVECFLKKTPESSKFQFIISINSLKLIINLEKYKEKYLSLINLYQNFLSEISMNQDNKNNMLQYEKSSQVSHNDSAFDISVQMEKTQFIIPDKKGDIILMLNGVDVGEEYVIKDFALERNGRNIIFPTNISIHMSNSFEVSMKTIASQIDPSDFWAILDLIGKMKDILKTDVNQTESDKNEILNMQEIVSIYTVNILEKGVIYLYDKKQLTAVASTGPINICAKMGSIKTDITLNAENSTIFQLIDGKFYNLLTFPEEKTINLSYTSQQNENIFEVSLPVCEFNLTNEIYRYVLKWMPSDEDKVEENEYTNESINSTSKYVITSSKMNVNLINGIKNIGYLILNDLNVNVLLFVEKFEENKYQSCFDLNALTSKCTGYAYFKQPDFQFLIFPSGLSLRYCKDCFTLKSTNFQFSCSYKIINILLEFASNLIADEFTHIQLFKNDNISIFENENKTENSCSTFTLGFGLHIQIDKIYLTFIPNESYISPCKFKLNDMNFVLNLGQCLSGISIDSIILTIKNANPDCSMIIKSINGVFAINNIEKELNLTEIDSILSNNYSTCIHKVTFNSINGTIGIENIEINYSHLFAKSIIHSFLIEGNPKYFQTVSLASQEYTLPTYIQILNNEVSKINDISDNSSIHFKLNASIQNVKLGIFLVDPIASIEFIDMNAELADSKWNANVKTFYIYEKANCEESLISSPHDSNFIHFTYENNNLKIKLSDITANIDYLFYLNIANFIKKSPFFHIPQIVPNQLNLISTSSSSMSLQKEIEVSESLPFNITIDFERLFITIPISIEEKSKSPLFHIGMDFYSEITDSCVKGNISNLKLHFSDQQAKIDYVPILDNFSLSFLREIDSKSLNSNSHRISLSISDMFLKLSAIDLVSFIKMSENIKKATSIMTFSEDLKVDDDTLSIQKFFSSLTFNSSKCTIVICKDNRTSVRFIPMFNIIIPPIKYQFNLSESVGSMNLSIEPYIEYYNEITGFWDMILEPVSINILAVLTNDQFQINFHSDNMVNFNFPAHAISKFRDFANEVKQNTVQSAIKYVELPNFWIENSLGSEVMFKISENGEYFILTHDQKIPIFKIETTSKIFVCFKNETFSFTPNLLTYPLYLNEEICAVRSPYQGGISIQLKSNTEIYNKLLFDIDIFLRKSNSSQFDIIATVKSKETFPLFLPKEKSNDLIIAQHNTTTAIKHQILTISNADNAVYSFLMGVKFEKHEDFRNSPKTIFEGSIKACLSVSHQISSGTRLFSLFAPFKAISHIPVPLHIKFENNDSIFLQCEKNVDLYVPNGKSHFKASVSLDGYNFSEYTKLNMKTKDPQKIIISRNDNISLAVTFEYNEDSLQTTGHFFTPVGLFNFSTYDITLFEGNERQISYKGIFSLWCPKSYFSNKKNLTVNILFEEFNSTIYNFDCTTPRTRNLFVLPDKYSDEKICIGLRYDVLIKNQASIITISPLVQIVNNLDINIALQPIDKANKVIYGDPLVISKNSQLTITKMTNCGTFMFSSFGYSTTPLLSLITEQKTVFKLQSQIDYLLIEIEVIDVGTNFECIFRHVVFPSPIIICNCLDSKMIAYHLYDVQPFVIDSHSTSVFAYDEPLNYPNVHICIDKDEPHTQETIQLNLSLVEDTDYIKTKAIYNNKPIYVSISKVINGSRAITITTEIPKIEDVFSTTIQLQLSLINISIIDFHMNEFALIVFDNVKSELQLSQNYRVAKLSIGNLQINDQDPHSPSPVLYGRESLKTPFFSLTCIIPSDVPFLTHFTYCSVVFQRIDIDLDSVFLSDIYYFIIQITQPPKSIIHPQLKNEKNDTSLIITFDWLEMSPIYIMFGYFRKSGRKARIHKQFKYFKYIPSINNGKVLLPGILATNISDTFGTIKEKILMEYKTHTFHQILSMLGGGGKLLTTFGITAMIAEMLDVKLDSDLSHNTQNVLEASIGDFQSQEDQILNPSWNREEEFDNRKSVSLAFSQQVLDTLCEILSQARMKQSDIILGIRSKQDIGLSIKCINNNGGSQGILGVITKNSSNTMKEISRMIKAKPVRAPRAYPNNIISIFDDSINRAQYTIQTYSKDSKNERIRLTAKLSDIKNNESINAKIVCISDSFITIIIPPQQLEEMIQITNVDTIIFADLTVEITYFKTKIKQSRQDQIKKNTIYIIAQTSEEAEKIYKFINSQKIMLNLFGISLLQ